MKINKIEKADNMEMKTVDIENKIEEIKAERDKNQKKYVKPLSDKIIKLEQDRIESIIKNKEYVTDLSEWEGESIYFTAINSHGEELFLPTDEIVKVRNGKIYCSSYLGGIVEWRDEYNSYIKSFYGSQEKLDILGFIDIEI